MNRPHDYNKKTQTLRKTTEENMYHRYGIKKDNQRERITSLFNCNFYMVSNNKQWKCPLLDKSQYEHYHYSKPIFANNHKQMVYSWGFIKQLRKSTNMLIIFI